MSSSPEVFQFTLLRDGLPRLFTSSSFLDEVEGVQRAVIDNKFEFQSTGITSNSDVIHAARELTTIEYLKKGYISQADIDDEGVISDESDPYTEDSYYYVVMDDDDRVAATTRKIVFNPDKQEESFPVWAHKDELYPEHVAEIEAIGLDRCVEISALAKDKHRDTNKTATLELYRSLYQDAISSESPTGVDEKAFLMALNPALYEQFKNIFGGGLERIGPNLDYPGEEVVPAILRTVEGSVGVINEAGRPDNESAEAQSFVVRYMLEGCSADTLDPRVLDALEENGFDDVLEKLYENMAENDAEEVDNPTLLERLAKRKPEIFASVALLGYSALRTTGVKYGISPHSNVDWRVFFGIEAATTPAYVMSMGSIVRSARSPELYSRFNRRRSEVTAATMLTAPYAYVAANGEGMPSEAWMAVGGLFALGSLSAVMRTRKERRQQQHNEQSI